MLLPSSKPSTGTSMVSTNGSKLLPPKRPPSTLSLFLGTSPVLLDSECELPRDLSSRSIWCPKLPLTQEPREPSPVLILVLGPLSAHLLLTVPTVSPTAAVARSMLIAIQVLLILSVMAPFATTVPPPMVMVTKRLILKTTISVVPDTHPSTEPTATWAKIPLLPTL